MTTNEDLLKITLHLDYAVSDMRFIVREGKSIPNPEYSEWVDIVKKLKFLLKEIDNNPTDVVNIPIYKTRKYVSNELLK